MTPDQVKKEALDRLRAWDETGAYFDLRVTGPDETNLKLVARFINATDSWIDFQWQLDTMDSPPKRSFAHSDGSTRISLEDATVTLSDDPRPFLTISRGEFQCRIIAR